MADIKKFENFQVNEELVEGPEKGNQKFVTSPRPNVVPSPQSSNRSETQKNELVELIWKIKPETTTENNDGLIWTSDVIQTIETYFESNITNMPIPNYNH